MFGQMMDLPLLISDQIEFAARFHGPAEVVTRTVEGPIHRSTLGRDRQARAQARQRAPEARASSKATASPPSPGTRIATSRCTSPSQAWGRCCTPSIPRLPLDQLRYVVDHAEDVALFFDTTFVKLAQFIAKQPNPVRHYVALTDAAHLPADSDIPGLCDYEGLIAGEPDTFTWPVLDEHTASSLCYTSGTAGFPKGVLYSHRSTILHSYAICMNDALGDLRGRRHAPRGSDVSRQRVGRSIRRGDDRRQAGAARARARPRQPHSS